MNTTIKTLGTSTGRALLLSCVLGAAGITTAWAQAFDSGSNGSLGDVIINDDTALDLPVDGILHCKKFEIHGNKVVSFNRNASNTPIFILCQEDAIIEGRIFIDGAQGSPADAGLAGPGGFSGGRPSSGNSPPGAGGGPGGGRAGIFNTTEGGAGSGSYLSAVSQGGSTNVGKPYGTPVLIPLIGGSGGGGSYQGGGGGGGGGGGAILIASNTRITFGAGSGEIFARGGSYYGGAGNGGSGGAIRLVAPVVNGPVRTRVYPINNYGGPGRVRVDTHDASGLSIDCNPPQSFSRGAMLVTGLTANSPRLDILEAAGTDIPEGQATPVNILLPNGTPAAQTVTVQAKNFGTKVPINVVLTPDYGDPVTVQAEIDNVAKNPATVVVNVNVPINVPVTVNVWTR